MLMICTHCSLAAWTAPASITPELLPPELPPLLLVPPELPPLELPPPELVLAPEPLPLDVLPPLLVLAPLLDVLPELPPLPPELVDPAPPELEVLAAPPPLLEPVAPEELPLPELLPLDEVPSPPSPIPLKLGGGDALLLHAGPRATTNAPATTHFKTHPRMESLRP
jgi:hypothetical protein